MVAANSAIDEIILESDWDNEGDYLDASLFGSLSLSSSQSSQKSGTFHEGPVSSPIQRLGRRRPCDPDRCAFRQNKEVPLDLPTSDENDAMRRHNPVAYYLLNDAWRCLRKVYGTMADMEDLQTKLSSGRQSARSALTSAVPPAKQATENKENRTAGSGPVYHRKCLLPDNVQGSAGSDSGPAFEGKVVHHPDPSLRRVVQLVPGQLLYRHDPVTKFELYREEWARRPAPGEEKRLALRWKVREYMLRQDIPNFDPRTSARPYAVHPRDWSPRPYID